MSANDKAAATYGRQPMTIAEIFAVHEWDYDAKNDACCCKCNGWMGPGPFGDEENDTWERHVAEMLEPLIVGREQEAWAQGVKTTLNHAIDNDDGITLRLEHLDGRPWENPYHAGGASG